jgi:hypothetical protein
MGKLPSGCEIGDIYQRELDRLRRVAEAGSELAPAAALFYCAAHEVRVPEWLVGRAAHGYCNQLNSSRPRKRGRSSGPLERYRQDMIDFIRWNTVKTARWEQEDKKDPERLSILDTYSERSCEMDEHRMKLIWFGHDWLRAYECASMMLNGTPAFAGPDAMKTSYGRVEDRMDDPKESWRYCYFEPEFLESIGLQHPSRWNWSTKFTPLYNLTL